MNPRGRIARETGRQEAERSTEGDRGEAIEVSRARRALIAHMRHELHTPLNAIIGYPEMLLEDAEELGEECFLPDGCDSQA